MRATIVVRVIRKFQKPGVIVRSLVRRRRNLITSASSPIIVVLYLQKPWTRYYDKSLFMVSGKPFDMAWKVSIWDPFLFWSSGNWIGCMANGLCALIAMVAYCQGGDFPTWGWRDDTVLTCHCHCGTVPLPLPLLLAHSLIEVSMAWPKITWTRLQKGGQAILDTSLHMITTVSWWDDTMVTCH